MALRMVGFVQGIRLAKVVARQRENSERAGQDTMGYRSGERATICQCLVS